MDDLAKQSAKQDKGGGVEQSVGARFVIWARRVGLERKVAIVLLLGALISGVTTLAAMTGNFSAAADPASLLILFNIDFILLLALIAIVVRRFVLLWLEWKRGRAGSRLHSRLVGLFAIVAVTPTIVVAFFSVVLFEFGLQGWFNARVSTAVKESYAVAESYLEEHRQSITSDALAVSLKISEELNSLTHDEASFDAFLTEQANDRNLTEVVVFDENGQVQGKAAFSFLLNFNPQIPEYAIKSAVQGEVVILEAETEDRVRALVYLGGFDNSFLLVGRLLDPNVLRHIERAKKAVALYNDLEGQRSGFVITFALIFAIVALMLLLAAVWVGLAFANHLSVPISNLIAAAEKIREGRLDTRVDTTETGDEVGTLSRTFNSMTGELQQQQQQLLDANAQLDERSRFIEAVLGGVTAGVIGLDAEGRITLPNRTAEAFFNATVGDLKGRPIGELIPEIDDLLAQARERPSRPVERHVPFLQDNGHQRTLSLRVVAEVGEHCEIIGFVITFDDITELVAAQRKAAWADVARRIAHEIKNPLTPIQLSAERLKRKYLKEIQSDKETFALCTDTIVRHVTDIGHMVSEFSSFARMPAPSLSDTDLKRLIQESVFLQREAHPEISFDVELPEEEVVRLLDSEQINRVLTNLLLNAAESIEGKQAQGGDNRAEIKVSLRRDGECDCIVIADTGKGLPAQGREKLTEPYVTTREKGTGLGLAIVKKIMEDHGGYLVLEDNMDDTGRVIGAKAVLVFSDNTAQTSS